MSEQRHCRRVQERLSAYQDGELKPAEREGITAHLQGCQACRETYEELEKVWQSLGDLPEIQPAPGFYAGLLRRIGGQQKVGPIQRLRWSLHAFPAPLATLTVLVAGVLVGAYLGNLFVTGELLPSWSRSVSTPQVGVTLASLRVFDPIPPGTLGEGYLRTACDLKDGHR